MSNPRRILLHPRDEIMQIMQRIYRYRMTTTSGGNLSIRDENGDIWITPARVDKGTLRRDDMVCVHPDGTVSGAHRPSSEFPFHHAIYEARPDIGGIVHAHSVALVAFSITGSVPDTRLFHKAHSVCGQPGFAPYALPGSQALAEQHRAGVCRRARIASSWRTTVWWWAIRGCRRRSSASKRSSSRPRRSSRRGCWARCGTWTTSN